MNKKGCIWGCSIVLALALLISGGIGLWIYSWYSHLRSFTSAKPKEITVYSPSKAEETEVRAKGLELKNAIKNDEAVDVSFTGDDINTLIATSPDTKQLKGKVYFTINGDELSAEGSVPLSQVPLFRDRFLNGKFSLNITMKNGKVWATVKDAVLNGKKASPDILKKLQEKNLADEMYKDPEKADFIRKFASIEVEDGKLIIKTKGKSSSGE